MKLNFSGNRALILGGTCDLALSFSELLIQEGLFPILTYRNETGRKQIKNRLINHAGKHEDAWLDLAVQPPIHYSTVAGVSRGDILAPVSVEYRAKTARCHAEPRYGGVHGDFCAQG